MKKVLSILVVFVGILVFTGCESNAEKTMNCTRSATITSGIKMDLDYKITYKGDYVTYIESVEKVISDDEDVLDAYKDQLETEYEPYADLDHYSSKVAIKGDTLTSTTKIDYAKIDTDKLIEIDSANSTLIEKDGKLKISTVQSLYESVGATCK